jgi:dihydrofolate reductase
MRRLILKMSMSLDGFVAGPGGGVDWIFKNMDAALTDWIVASLHGAGLHIMGSRTFRDMAAYWPYSSEAFATPMNDIPKAVFSRSGDVLRGGTTTALQDASRLRPVDQSASGARLASWTGARVIQGDLAQEIARLKQEPGGDILAHGGVSFASSLVRLRLVDEYQLVVHPVLLGRGQSSFSELAQPLELMLLETTRFPGGVVAQVYRPA